MTVEFGATVDEVESRPRNPKYRKTEFLALGPGEHRVRILDPMEVKKYTHYLGYAYLECLGEECPVCKNNKQLMYEHPEDFREFKGWNARRARFYINVFDKTPTKVCPKCGTEKQDATEVCPACATPLGEAQPLNKVKVLSMGRDLIDDIKIQSQSVRTENDERVDIRSYDWMLTVRGVKLDKKINVAHRWYPGKENVQDIGEQTLFDLENVTVKLTPEEMVDVMNGASLKDIFAVRRAKKEESTVTLSEEVNSAIDNAVDELFNS